MLTLGPDSKCDVCFETFDAQRVPCSIRCGHSFCFSCLSALKAPRDCPLCRRHCDKLTYHKLYIDWDASQTDIPEPDQLEAKRLFGMVRHMADHGANKEYMSNVLQEMSTFFSSRPSTSFPELSMCNRMIKLIYQLREESLVEHEDLKDQLQKAQEDLKDQLQSADDARAIADSRIEEYRMRNHFLEDELIRMRKENRHYMTVVERLSGVIHSLSVPRPTPANAGRVSRIAEEGSHSSPYSFDISPFPAPDAHLERSPSLSEQSEVEKQPDVHDDTGSSSEHLASDEDDEDDSEREYPRAQSNLGRHSTSDPRRSYHRQVSPSPTSSIEDPDALPLQARLLNGLLSDPSPRAADSPPLSDSESLSQEEASPRSRAPSRFEQIARPAVSPSPAAVASSWSRASDDTAPRSSSRYNTTLPPATSASAAAQQALERSQRQAQLREAERSRASQEEEVSGDRRRSSSRGDRESMTYRMASASSQSMRQPVSSAQPAPAPARPMEPAVASSRTGYPYSSHSSTVRQTSASGASRPQSQYFSASSTVARSKSGNLGRPNA